MYEETRRFSWTTLFIRIIVGILFVLFAVWLLSLSNRGISNSLAVLTDNIFEENIDRMKEVGEKYFTTERLPQKVGEVKKLSLAKMYDENLILEVKDKNGNACSATNSYVSVEKMDKEYKMRVYLECGDESNFINVVMGCYNYCENDICGKKEEEKKEEVKPQNNQPQNNPISYSKEYEYVKTTSGYWTDYSDFTAWTTTKVDKTDSRDVETKTIKESYTVDKQVTEAKLMGNATCENVSGYKLVSTTGNTCNYVANNKTVDPTCPEIGNGYKLTGRNEFTCNYSKTTSYQVTPTCPEIGNGYTLTGRNGMTCNYSKPYTVDIGGDYRSTCDGCGLKYFPHYVTKYKTMTTTATCPNGSCTGYNTVYETATATCKEGKQSGNTCVVENNNNKTTKVATCPSGQYAKDGKCYKDVTTTKKVTETKDVTYYRYRVREYVDGYTDYKWSTSNNDNNLVNAGYKLTGKTR